jgi:hypothetical protein
MGEQGKTADQPRKKGRFDFKNLSQGRSVPVGERGKLVSDAAIITTVKRPFEDMASELSATDKKRFDRISDGYVSPDELISIASDPDSPAALQFAVAHTHPSFIEWGLGHDDWRVQVGALTNISCDINEVDIEKIDGRAMDAAIISASLGEVNSQSILVMH